jgi:hypothetical protein
MELERNKSGLNGRATTEKRSSKTEVSKSRLDSQNSESAKATTIEVPSIRLSPEQIEEIHVDEYTLTLFYATRVQPMTLNDIKRQFAEPEPKKAQSVLDRFIKVGLIHITPEGTYYSNFPDNYINYSHYRYDGDLEARKDSKVFEIMKEFTGKSEFWKDKTYFSMDAFYSKEQSDELLEMFKAIKLKAKDFANENAKKKSIDGLKFRRMKFYDMTFAILLAFLVSLGISTKSYAGGNDPVGVLFKTNPVAAWNFMNMARFAGGGNDPTAMMNVSNPVTLMALSADVPPGTVGGGGHDPNGGRDPVGGGGHDPTDPPTAGVECFFEYEGQYLAISSKRTCKLKILIDYMNACGNSNHKNCIEAERQTDLLIQRLQLESKPAE